MDTSSPDPRPASMLRRVDFDISPETSAQQEHQYEIADLQEQIANLTDELRTAYGDAKTIFSQAQRMRQERDAAKRALAEAYVQLEQWEAAYGEHALRDASHALAEHEKLRRQLAMIRVAVPNEIRAELVCCNIYEKDQGTERAGKTHAICFWGEAAARIAEDEIESTLTGAVPVILDTDTVITFPNDHHQYVMTTRAARCSPNRCDCGQMVLYLHPNRSSTTTEEPTLHDTSQEPF